MILFEPSEIVAVINQSYPELTMVKIGFLSQQAWITAMKQKKLVHSLCQWMASVQDLQKITEMSIAFLSQQLHDTHQSKSSLTSTTCVASTAPIFSLRLVRRLSEHRIRACPLQMEGRTRPAHVHISTSVQPADGTSCRHRA